MFDPEIAGHHLEYLRHVARYGAKQSAHDLYFAVHPDIETLDPELCDCVRAAGNHLTLHPLSRHDYEQIEGANAVQRAWRGWKALEAVASTVDAEHCILMEMNAYQPVLGMPRARRAPFSVSGILFFPFVRIEPERNTLGSRLQARLERARKDLQLRWVLSNPNVENLFVLNDEWAARALNERFGRNRFTCLPDPVPSLVTDDEEHEFEWDPARSHFLLFGSLRLEKGVLRFLDAVHRLSDEEAKRLGVHLLGKTRSDLRDDLPARIDRLRKTQPNLSVHFEDRFLSETELDGALRSTDFIVAPYLRTEGSSGVLGHAAHYERPVVGPNTGLIGSLIDEYDLGLTVDTVSTATLTDGLRRCLDMKVGSDQTVGSVAGMRRYVSERTPEAFAKKLFYCAVASFGEQTVQH